MPTLSVFSNFTEIRWHVFHILHLFPFDVKFRILTANGGILYHFCRFSRAPSGQIPILDFAVSHWKFDYDSTLAFELHLQYLILRHAWSSCCRKTTAEWKRFSSVSQFVTGTEVLRAIKNNCPEVYCHLRSSLLVYGEVAY